MEAILDIRSTHLFHNMKDWQNLVSFKFVLYIIFTDLKGA